MTSPALFFSPARIIQFAYEDAGIVAQGDTPNSEMIARAMERLNDIINFWQTQGVKLWLVSDQSFDIVQGQALYTIESGGDIDLTKPMRVLQGYLLSSANVRTPLTFLSWDDYLRLSNVATEGASVAYFVNKTLDSIEVSLYPTPNAATAAQTGHLLLQVQVTNFISLTETIDFPREWFMALRWALADDLATGQPEAIVQRCAQRAKAFREALDTWDGQVGNPITALPGNYFPQASSAQTIIADAMQDAKLLAPGNTPNGEQLTKYMRTLNDVANYLQTQGLKLWTQTDVSITLVDGQQAYTLMPAGSVNMTRPLRALQGYYLDANNVSRPIEPLSWNEWITLANRAEEGPVTQYFVEKLIDRLKVYFWLIPDATAALGTAHLLIQQQIDNFVVITDTMDFPVEWRLALRWCLAAEICSGQPPDVVQRCQGMAQFYRTALENWDVEDASVQFMPDQRMTAQYRSFS